MHRPHRPDRARRGALAILLVSALLAGCAPKEDHVVFVTRTTLGVDFDSEPPTAAIGYDRVEGYLGPRSEDGSVPPVLASIQSSGGPFNSDVRQTYATGSAAVAIARSFANPPVAQPELRESDEIVGAPRLMFFGTSSTVGLKVASATTGVASATFGYKRKEVSVIPLAKVGTTPDGRPRYKYPSVVAAMDTTAGAQGATGARLSNVQFFATGLAADYYGRSDAVQEAFKKRSEESIDAFNESEAKQRILAGGILSCYAALYPDQRPKAWIDAFNRGLLLPLQEEGGPEPPRDAVLKWLLALNESADVQDPQVKRVRAGQASQTYATYIAQPSGFEAEREKNLGEHEAAVCTLAKG